MDVERKRSPFLDLARPEGVAVEIDFAEAVDVLMSIWAIGGRPDADTFDEGRSRAEEVQARLLAILPRWHDEVYVPNSAEALVALERDAQAKRELARTRSPEQLIEIATNGVQYSPGPEISRVVLFPGYWQRPWVLMNEFKHVKIFCYPLALDHGEEG